MLCGVEPLVLNECELTEPVYVAGEGHCGHSNSCRADVSGWSARSEVFPTASPFRVDDGQTGSYAAMSLEPSALGDAGYGRLRSGGPKLGHLNAKWALLRVGAAWTDSYRYVGLLARCFWPSDRIIRIQADVVVYSILEPLLAAEVSLRRLDGNVAQQKLDLLRSPPAWWHNLAQVLLKSCGATKGRPQVLASRLTTAPIPWA